MFATTKQRSSIGSALNMSRLIFHSVVRKIRQSHRVPLMSIFSSILQTVMFVLAFLLMFDMLGMRGAAIRGDFVLYIMSGIFLFQVHTQSLGAVSGAESSASPMMQHAPMNTIISICAAAISSLYTQVMALSCILLVYYVGIQSWHYFNCISTRQYVGIGQNVCCKHSPNYDVGNVRLEPALSRYRPSTWIHIYKLYAQK